jgi:triacylglycerol lipase
MSALGLVPSGVPDPSTKAADLCPPTPPAALQLSFEDALASRRRLWVRGRLRGLDVPTPPTNGRHWWAPWHKAEPPPPAQLHLTTKISGTVLETTVPLQADGRFEALLEAELPVARRGWRLARCRATVEGQSAEACSLVLAPAAGTGDARAVLIPPEFSYDADGLRRLASSEFAERITRQLRGTDAGAPVFYVACVPPDADNRQAELALAATALGWPAGAFVLLPAAGDEQPHALEFGIERLHWLFEGSRQVKVLSAGDPVRGNGDGVACGCRPVPAVHYRRPSRAGLLPRSPVVFCHGMLACSLIKMSLPADSNCFSPLREFLNGRGFRVLYPQVPPTSGVVERAASLREQILRWTDEPVNVIAHSMGGLDARYMITHLGMAERVRSLTTVSTPHRGTYLAEWFRDNFRHRVPLLLALEALGVNVDGFRDCVPAACAVLNAQTPDMPGVTYFSYGGSVPASRVSPVLRRAWNILAPVEGPNDGMVSMASARWGQYLGTVGADHFAQTPDGVFLRPGEDFDALGFCTRLVEDLAHRGF